MSDYRFEKVNLMGIKLPAHFDTIKETIGRSESKRHYNTESIRIRVNATHIRFRRTKIGDRNICEREAPNRRDTDHPE